MPLITKLPELIEDDSLETVLIAVDRFTLQKKRWRKLAEDGQDVAVDLAEPCKNGQVVFVDSLKQYVIRQNSEPVIIIAIPGEIEAAAFLGWMMGNQHLPVEIKDKLLRLSDEKTVRDLLKRAHIEFTLDELVFSPNPHSRHHHH